MLAMAIASTRAMMQPDTRDAQLYFCSSQMASATDTHITPSRPQVSSV